MDRNNEWRFFLTILQSLFNLHLSPGSCAVFNNNVALLIAQTSFSSGSGHEYAWNLSSSGPKQCQLLMTFKQNRFKIIIIFFTTRHKVFNYTRRWNEKQFQTFFRMRFFLLFSFFCRHLQLHFQASLFLSSCSLNESFVALFSRSLVDASTSV